MLIKIENGNIKPKDSIGCLKKKITDNIGYINKQFYFTLLLLFLESNNFIVLSK